MLKDAKAFSGFAVDDVARAKQFYGSTLGLDVIDAPLGVKGADVPAGLEIRTRSDTKILIYPKPDHTPATFTIPNFVVPDIERAVDELMARGVRFEQHETPGRTRGDPSHPESATRRLVPGSRRQHPLGHRGVIATAASDLVRRPRPRSGRRVNSPKLLAADAERESNPPASSSPAHSF